MPWLLVAAAFVVVPLAELWAILSVGDAIGVLPTVLILFADSVLGAVLLRAQGRGAWRRFLDAFRSGRVPSRELADGLLILVGGALLLTPGFFTDAVGLLLLIPPTRALVRRTLERAIARRMTVAVAGTGRARAFGADGAGGAGRARTDFDVEGSATEPADPAGSGPPRLDR